jgi:alanyl-tRNA synthetase
MVLSETNEQIKADLMKFVNGEYNDYFTKEQIDMATELSFLFNHISVEGDSVIFEYGDEGIKLSNLHDMPFISEDSIISMIRNDEFFKSSYKSFLRDYKLNKIIK